jgi:hypothetical protein
MFYLFSLFKEPKLYIFLFTISSVYKNWRKMFRCCSRAESDGEADILGIEVVLHDALDDGGQLGLHERVAGLLEPGDQCSQQHAQLHTQITDLKGLGREMERAFVDIYG